MSRKRHNPPPSSPAAFGCRSLRSAPPEEIVTKLRQVEVLTAQGRTVAEAIRSIGVTEVTFYRWRQEYGGLKGDQVKRLKASAQELPMPSSRQPARWNT